MKVLVTGGAGFIGSHIVDKCIDAGHQVIVVDNLSTGKRENLNQEAIFHCIDIRDSKLDEVFQKEQPEVVIHQAAQIHVGTSVKEPVVDGTVNVVGTINLLECCRKNEVQKIVYASTAAVYGNPVDVPIDEKHPVQPLSPYGCSKYCAEKYIEMYAQLYGIKYTILRYANVYGERQDPRGEGGVISVFVDQTLEERTLTIFGDGKQTRDYIYVGDVATANIQAIMFGCGEILNVGTGVSTSLNEVVRIFGVVSEKGNDVEYGPERMGDIKHSYFNPQKACGELQWEPAVDLIEGLRKTYAYYVGVYRRMNKD